MQLSFAPPASPSFAPALTSGSDFTAGKWPGTCSSGYCRRVPRHRRTNDSPEGLKPFRHLPIGERMASQTPQDSYDLVCPLGKSSAAAQFDFVLGGVGQA